MNLEAADKALSKAKIALMTKPDSVFFCDLAFSFKYVWDETIPTAAVDGVSIFINPKFFMEELTPDERVGVILHETMHVVYMHLDRRNDRDPKRWNIAGDHVINLVLRERGFKLPDWVYADQKYTGWNTNQVYDDIDATQYPDTDLDIRPSAIPSEEMAERVQDMVVRAAIRSEQEGDKSGTIPGEIQLLLDKLLKPQLPWQKILSRHFREFDKTEFTYKKPNRRFFPEHYFPSMHGSKLEDLAIAVDISGSVTDVEFKYFVSEITSIFRMGRPKNITVIQFDTRICHVNTVSNIQELLNIKFSGRGGTDIKPVIDWANENKPKLMLVFTDGEFRIPVAKTKVNWVWLIHGSYKFKPLFGKVINYTMPT